MKRLKIIFLLVAVCLSLAACRDKAKTTPEVNTDAMEVDCSKDSIDEFFAAAGKINGDSLLSGYAFDEEHCFNVTPAMVAEQTSYKIFKFSDSCASFILIEGEVFYLCASFGGYGFVDAVPCDFDEDGYIDLLVASSWGSGIHRSEISVFNTKAKESTVIYDTSTTNNPSIDLFVTTQTPSSSTDGPVYYSIYSANIEVIDNNFANLAYTATGLVGSVEAENGVPVFKAYEE